MNFTKFPEKVFSTVYAKLLLLCAVLFTATASFGQAPPNDNANQATVLTPGATCAYITGTNLNGTTSTGTASPGCGFASGVADVWFRALVPAGGALTFDMQPGTMTDATMAVYRGTNAIALTYITCATDGSANANMPKITVTGLTPGTSVFVRIWAGNGVNGTFGICATIPVPPPANDEPCNATELSVSPTCNYQTFTTESATNTTSVGAPIGCASYSGGDVWFKVVVPAGITALVFDTQRGVVTEGGMLVYKASSCTGVFTEIDCDSNSSANLNMPKVTAGGLAPGDTVWVRFWERGNNNNGNFGICVTLPPPPPAYDDPCSAVELIASETCTFQQFTNQNATGTSGIPDPGCANYNGADVWFKVLVPAGGALNIDTDDGVMTDGGMAVYRGACNNLTIIDCDDNSSVNGQMPSLTVAGLTPGDTLWVRIWENNGDNNGTFSICAKIPPPGPVNDDPCGAIELIVSPTCNTQTFSNESATGTSTVDDPSCTTYNGGDVWFKAVVPADGVLVISTAPGGITDAGMAAYSGTCQGTLTEIECDDDDGDGNMPKLTLSGLTPNDTILIRVWEFGGDLFGTFGICVTPPPPPPSNDNPCNAAELTVNATCTYQTFTNLDALNSPGVPDPGCGDYDGSDVWFKVVVPAGGSVQIDTDEGGVTDGAMAAYSGNCGSLALIGCDDDGSANGAMPKLVLTGLNPGDTIWIRVWEAFNDNNGSFGICATIPPPPPTNDDPCNAVELPVDPAACTFQTFSNETATDSPGVPAPGCANYQGSDVWFKAVVPAGGAIRFNTDEAQMTDGGMAIYTGNCSALTLLTCDDNSSENGDMPKLTLTGLTAGDTLWVRMWSNSGDNDGTFGICATVPPPPPSNDDPCNAIPLTADSTCTFQTFTNENSGNTLGVPAPGCASYQGGDVWFSVVVPSGGALQFDSQTGVITDGGMAIYRGSCGNLTLIDCDDDGSTNGNMSFITAGGLTPGDTIWIRMWEFGNDNQGTFGLCVKLLPPGPANDAPCGAIEIPVAATCTYQTFTNAGSFGTANLPDPTCAGYDDNDVWFKVVVPAEGAVTFDTQAGGITDGGMAVYSGTTCGTLTLIECDDDDGTGNMPKITVGGANPGDTLWVRVWDAEFAPDNGTFGICATIPPPPPANDNPCTSTNIPVEAGCNFQQFSNDGAFSTAGVPAPGCGDYQGGDVWFNVIVPAEGAITFDSRAGVVTDGGMAVYRGTCNNLTLIECDDDDGTGNMPKMTLGGLNPGDTLWVRFWEEGNNNNGTFSLCATIPPPPPVNDNPCGAIALIAIDSCSYQTFTNVSSYGTTSVPNPTCGDYQGSDVWFKVVVPRAGALNINTQAGSLTDAAMAIYKADSCNGTMELLTCDDNGSANPGMPYITATGITPGSTLWIRVWSNGGNLNQGTFGICTAIPPLQPATFAFTCSRDTVFTCGGGDTCFTLDAIIPDIHALSDRYAVNPLSAAGCFNPYSDPGNEGPAVELTRDDIYSELINLPFTFPFFGTNYNSLVASTNGYISFDAANLASTPGAPVRSEWQIRSNAAGTAFGTARFLDLPSALYDRALIMGPYHDLDPGENTSPTMKIKYNVTGQAPNRRWVLSFYKVPMFDCTDLIENTHQIVLYEGIGVVEVFLFDMQVCATWNGGGAMVGMQDFTRTKAIMAPGRAASNSPWARPGLNESWRFVPIAGPRLFKRVELFDTLGNFLATGDTTFLDSATLKVNFRNLCALQRLPAGQNTLLVRAVYTSFNDPTQEQVGADTINIFIPNLRVNFDVANAQCGNPIGAVTIHTTSGLAPFQFSSDSAVTPVPDSVFTNLAPGKYYFTVRDAAGCARDTIITINNPQPIIPQYTVTSAACNGDSGVVSIATNGIRPIRYSSDGGATYQRDSTFRLPAGVYNFRVIDTASCQKDTTITVTAPQPIFGIYVDSATRCNGDASGVISITGVIGGTGPFTYSFDNGAYSADSTLNTFAPGVHPVSIRDANGCTKDTTITISEPAVLAALYINRPVTCDGTGAGGGIAVPLVTGGTAPYTYSFDGNGYASDTVVASLSAGPHTVSIRDINGCTKDTTIEVAGPQPIFATYAVSNATCNGSSNGSVVVTVVSGGFGALEYSSDGGGAYQADDSLSVGAGPHVIRIRDANGCTKDTTITISEPAAITSTYAVSNAKCFANSGSIVVTASGGTGTYEYGIDASPYQADDSFAVTAGVYVVHIRDANGCIKDSSITVTQPDRLLATASAGSTGCNTITPTGTVTVTSTGGTRPLTYSTGTITQPDSTFTGFGANTYSITVTDANGCTVVAGATVGVVNDLVVQTREDTVICGEVAVVLYTNTNAQTITWSPGTALNSTSIASPTATNLTTTTEYVVTAQTGTCLDTDTVKVIVTLPPTVSAGQGKEIIKGLDAQLNGSVSNAASFAWSPTTYLTNSNTLAPISVMPQETIVYTLTATNAEGCSSSDTVTVTVVPYCIKVKNAFTPNGDGVNDNWMVYDQFDCLQNVRVQVFNRYGSRVFESKNYRNDWKGTYNNKNLPDATYYYVIDFLLSTGISYQLRGDVTILR